MLHRAAVLIFLTATTIAAQPRYFGPGVPLTNTRYAITPATDTATNQELVATVTIGDESIVVWNESGDAWAGLRAQSGTWRERLLTRGETAVAAASLDDGLIVVTQTDQGWSAAIVDSSLSIVRQTERVAHQAHAIASAGDAAVVAGVDATGRVVVTRVAPDGTISTPVAISDPAEDPVIASDGTSYLVAWQSVDRVEGLRIDAALASVDPAPILIAESAADPALAFSADHYVAAWKSNGFVRARRVKREGVVVHELIQTGRINGDEATHITISPLGASLAFTWYDGTAQVLVFDGWDVQTSYGFSGGSSARMLPFPDGTYAAVYSTIDGGEPFYGGSRLHLSIATAERPALPPEAPLVLATASGGTITVEWTPPPQTVSGYRVEYRVDGGRWLEVERSIDGAMTAAVFEGPRSGTYSIRVRAISDAGAGAYSEAIDLEVTRGRRRSVR